MNKILWFDLETTGLNPYVNEIVELSCIVEINKQIKHKQQYFIKPNKPELLTEETKKKLNINPDFNDIKYKEPQQVYYDFLKMLDGFDIRNKDCRFRLGGYNINRFDIQFLQRFFINYNDDDYDDNKTFFKYFETQSYDIYNLIPYIERDIGHKFISSKLSELSKLFGIKHNPHDSMSDIEATLMLDRIFQHRYFNSAAKKNH